ncbi:MAG: alpha/beta hydrolase [Chloroflexota bacterium]|nr:alpha/beta hydrolase [Chloroflexota bacterium]
MRKRVTFAVFMVAALVSGMVAACATPESNQSGEAGDQEMRQTGNATFVLVHGAYLGGWGWKNVTPLLCQRGHTVYAPSLTGLGERAHLGSPDVDLDTHIEDIVNLLIWEDLHDVILVGWSYGGMVVTGVLDRVPERVAHVVYLDADVPYDGDTAFDFFPEGTDVVAMEQQAQEMGDGWKTFTDSASEIEFFLAAWIPDDEMRRWAAERMAWSTQPFSTLNQPISLSNPAADTVSKTYIRCPLDGEFLANVYDPIVDRVRDDPLWNVIELSSNHMAPIANPDLVAEALLGVLDSLEEE